MIGTVHLVQAIVSDFPDDGLPLDIELTEIVLAVGDMTIVPIVKSGDGQRRNSIGIEIVFTI